MSAYALTPRSKAFRTLQDLLDSNYHAHNRSNAINYDNPDPLLILYKYAKPLHNTHESGMASMHDVAPKSAPDSRTLSAIALVCALFAYGNVRAIVGFLDSLPLGMLGERDCLEYFARYEFPYYRFQSPEDVKLLLLSLARILKSGGLERVLVPNSSPLEQIAHLIALLCQSAAGVLESSLARECFSPEYRAMSLAHAPFLDSGGFSRGFAFLIGSAYGSSPLKRWNMFLRWMVRSDEIDLGIWQGLLSPSDLLLPLDTHTHRISRELGLLRRASYDIRAVFEVSENLARFCPHDPIRYDFALYRIGQSRRFAKTKQAK